jgi:DNA mismatch endonuclease, patch repair protein
LTVDQSSYKRDGRAPIPEKLSTSRVMSANRCKNTTPEKLLRKALWSIGIRGYRLHPKNLPGRPDIFFQKTKIAIFVNGCFWPRCPNCHPHLPKSNVEFWTKKFKVNQIRDLQKIRQLESLGCRVLTIWECKIHLNLGDCINEIKKELLINE